MKVAFFSNFLNHHQLPFCLAMHRLTEGQFTFVATTPTPAGRMAMGYQDMNKQYPFVITAYDSDDARNTAMTLAVECDVMIIGSAPEMYGQIRLQTNKIVFYYSERLYKRGFWGLLKPRNFAKILISHLPHKAKPIYVLCASAYAAGDFALAYNFVGNTYKWGYFPEIKEHDIDELLECKRRNKKVHILWAGRLIEWKHPEAAIAVAERLKSEGREFVLNIVGNGHMEVQLKEMIIRKQLDDCVHLLGAMSPEDVRSHMEAADIYLFTSDYNEGWGAVLNEAMSSACAVVASHAIGAVPYLIRHGENGFIYRNGDDNDLYECVVKSLESQSLRESMGHRAYETLAGRWNADVAAERFVALAEALLNGENPELFLDGPCSKAARLKNRWF